MPHRSLFASTKSKLETEMEDDEKEVKDSYYASLITGAVAIAAILGIGIMGIVLLKVGLHWLHHAVRP